MCMSSQKAAVCCLGVISMIIEIKLEQWLNIEQYFCIYFMYCHVITNR